MVPSSPFKMLFRILFGRRNTAPEIAAGAAALTEARDIRVDAEAKLARTDDDIADTRGQIWLLHQRRDRNRNNGHQ